MSRRLLVLRPEPGASETAARIERLGLAPCAAPLFTVRPVAWVVPDPAAYDALMLTSANAVRHAGPGLGALAALPLFVVGDATARAARGEGLAPRWIGQTDGAALLAAAAAEGFARLLHLSGREHMALAHPAVTIDRRIVYTADAADALPPAAEAALREGGVALLHSPRAARLFAGLVECGSVPRGTIRIAALSPAVAVAAGEGWQSVGIAELPGDDALLAVAARMCE